MDIITNNPYRYLGVYSNSPVKERVANEGKMKAFLNVGKPVSFPLDLPGLLPPINRTTENVADAVSNLTLPTDQIRYAQFWWIKSTPFDDIAFKHLMKGDIVKAKFVWEKRTDAFSLQNRIVLALCCKDYMSALTYAEDLYTNYEAPFLSFIVDKKSRGNTLPLIHTFLDELIMSGVETANFQHFTTNDKWKNYIEIKTTKPLIDKITHEISTAKASKGKGPDARYQAGQKLIVSTTISLGQLKTLIPLNDIRYETIADKLGLEILQCSIDYYNDSDDIGCARKAIKMLKYAQSVVVGDMAIERCKRNGEIIESVAMDLPPQEVMLQYRIIMDEINIFRKLPSKTIIHSMLFLKKIRPYLREIRKILGKKNTPYLKISTNVINCALSCVIAEINKAYDNRWMLRRKQIKKILRLAWIAIEYMNKFDMDISFKVNQYTPNRTSIQDSCNNFGITTDVYISLWWVGIIAAFSLISGVTCALMLAGDFVGFLVGITAGCLIMILVGYTWKLYVTKVILKVS